MVSCSKEVLATGRDLYLMFKHEESPEGALHAETVLKKVGQSSPWVLYRFGTRRPRKHIPAGKPWYSHRISGKLRPESGGCPGFATRCTR
jgi:hypothetical protein